MGRRKRNIFTVEDLLSKSEEASGEEFANDRMMPRKIALKIIRKISYRPAECKKFGTLPVLCYTKIHQIQVTIPISKGGFLGIKANGHYH